MDTLTLLLPGALVPPDWSRDVQWIARLDRADAARRIARADPRPDAAAEASPPSAGTGPRAASLALPHEAWLAHRFGLTDGAAWHAASAHADGMADVHWRIDPVSLEVGLDRVVLAALPGTGLHEDEAHALAGAIAPVLREHGMELRVATPQRWYVEADEPLQLTTGTPLAALGRSIEAYLPVGPDARRWRRTLAEVEMTWHTHPVNTERERTRRVPVNSLWLTGPVPRRGAASPGARSSAPPRMLIGSDASLRGVAAAMHCMYREAVVPEDSAARGGETLLLSDGLLPARLGADPAAWANAWDALAAGVLREALAMLDDGRVGTLDVVATGQSRVRAQRLRRTDRWRPWQRLRAASLAAQWAADAPPVRDAEPAR